MDHDVTFTIPNVCTIQRIKQFLDVVAPIFGMEDRGLEHIKVITTQVEKMDIVGVLLVYKFVEYTAKKGCFKSAQMIGNNKFLYELQRLGFKELLNSFFLNLPADFNSLKYQLYNNVFIAPIKLNDVSEKEAKNNFYPQIRDYYKDTETCHIVLSVLCEIVSNFREHSKDETDSILVATGNKKKFEAVCADTGIGMIASLSPILKRPPSIDIRDFDILELATRQGITSKHDTNHMGYGLWLISEFVRIANGEIHLYSQGAFYVNQCGKIKKGVCGFWQGTIIYVSLPLNNVKELQKWQENLAVEYEDIKIKCV